MDELTGDLVAYVTRHMSCETCDESYPADHVQVVLCDDGQISLLASCPDCHEQRLITAFERPPYFNLHPSELVIPAPITTDTVDVWARFLADFTGDLADLLAQ